MRVPFMLVKTMVCLLLLLQPAWAGGPWYVDKQNSGRPFHWPQGAIVWYAEDGKLGPLFAEQIQKEIAAAFDQWAKAGLLMGGFAAPKPIQTAKISVKAGGVMTTDIRTDAAILKAAEERTVFVLDNKGDFINNPTLGAMTYIHLVNKDSLEIHTGFSILNGKAEVLENAKVNENLDPNWGKFRAILVHEIGHMLNLDHSALHAEMQDDVESGRDQGQGMPTMYPIIVSAAQKDLHTDDIVAISNLYPTEALRTEFCEIAGRVIGADGAGYQGAHIVAESALSPGTMAVGAVSGNLFWEGTADGTYILRGVHPGVPYNVRYEEIPPKFVNASAVQPYGDDFDDDGEVPRTGFGTGTITANAGTLTQVVCDKGGDAILMDTVQFGVSAGGIPPPVDLLPDANIVAGNGAGGVTDSGKKGCSLIF